MDLIQYLRQASTHDVHACSQEMPQAVLRWPAWKVRWVPKIMQALCPASAMTDEHGDSHALGPGMPPVDQ